MSEKHIDGGYILLSRKLIESAIWEKPPMYLKVWIYILSKAQHKAYKNLDRGELLITIPELIEVCSHKVGYRTERPSKSQIFNILEWLRNSGEGADEDDASRNMIDTTKTTRGMVVKVHNYNVYQDPSNYEQNGERNNEEVTTETMPKRQADTINKNVKNEKKEKKEIDADAQEIFDYYISKKLIAHQAFTVSMQKSVQKALKDRSLDEVKKVIDNYTTVYFSDAHYFSSLYSLEKLMRKKDIDQFHDEAKPLQNFLKNKGSSFDSTTHVYNKPEDTVIDINAGEDW